MSQPQNQEARKKKKDQVKQQDQNSSSNSQKEGGFENQSEENSLNSFIDDDEEMSQSYSAPYGGDISDDEEKKKKKREQKKEKKKLKEKKKKYSEGSLDEGDLDVIDDDDRKYSRLKKKKESRSESDYDQERLENEQQDQGQDYGEDIPSEDDGQFEEAEDSLSEMNEIINVNKDIFEPGDLKKLTIEEEDKELVETDLPERYIWQLRNYSKTVKKPVSELRIALESEEKDEEAEWIYNRIKGMGLLESYDEKECRERLKKTLEAMHRDHLDVMYIYYYRKKMFADFLSLEILWKVHELDEEWFLFKDKQKKMLVLLEELLPSYTQVPKELLDMIHQCPDQKHLKYFEDYEQFVLAKWTTLHNNLGSDKKSKRQDRNSFITQVSERRVAEELESSQIFLSPQNLCHNLRQRLQERKPKTPHNEPKDEFQRILKTQNPESDRVRYPLLATENRFKTITKYLCFQLFSYPELKKLLKERYYKKLVISTSPTKKGLQDIDLYSQYFPVKRIKEKSISTLRREVWILALQAQKLDLIKIELKFEWELNVSEKPSERDSRERDPIYLDIVKYYYDISSMKAGQLWNLFRKQIIGKMLEDYFFPFFMKEIREDLTREGEREIIHACSQKLKMNLNKGPSLKEGKPIKILSMVLEETKLGIAFVDESGKALYTFQINVHNDEQFRKFIGEETLSNYIKEYKPDMILIAANCKRAQTLRKQLRTPTLFKQSIFCAFGEYEVPRLVAKKKIIQGLIEEESILAAVSMARLKKNPLSEIVSLWSDKLQQNGILSLNLHQYQSFVNQKRLKDSLEKVIIEMVNLVGLDLNQTRLNGHVQNQLQFISGLGPKKSFVLLQKLKEQNSQILSRKKIEQFLMGKIVTKNCSPFFKIETSFHKSLFQKLEKQKKNNVIKQYEEINLLDMTRIPEQWYNLIVKKLAENYKPNSILDMRSRKQFSKLSDENMILLEIFKNPQRIRGIEWKFKENVYFDDELVKSQIMSRFKNPRDPERVMENREIFFNLLRETPQTFKRYMIMPVKVLSIKKNYLNVIIPQNGLFGYIKLQTSKTQDELQKIYEKGNTIKAIIIGFPFDQKTFRDQPSQEQQLLKIEMALDFPHKDNERHEGGMRHDCMSVCFPLIVKEIHPLIDLEKDKFQLRKQDRTVIEVKEERNVIRGLKQEFRRISHPKFKNIDARLAIQMMKSEQIGQFVIRPSSQGPEYLTITWNFFKGVIVHIKVKCEHKSVGSYTYTYRIEDRENRSFNSLEEIIEKYIKPMNLLVQDVTSNKKFLNISIDQIEDRVKKDMQNDSSHIYYYFGTSEEHPQFFLLIYMYKEKKPIRELVKVKSSGLSFHDQQFSNVRDLIIWFKQHLKEREYQRYVRNLNLAMKK